MKPLFDPALPVFIVGGGASLRDFDFNRLKRRQVIALNLAYRPVPWANVLFFGDNAFWEANKDPSGQHFWRFKGGKILTTASYCAGMSGRVDYVDPAELALADGAASTDLPDIDVGNINTGAQAILLAHALGAKKIVLLGFDGKPGHWAHGKPYAYQTAPLPGAFDAYAADFAKIAKFGLDVVNANPLSALTCFPSVKLETLL